MDAGRAAFLARRRQNRGYANVTKLRRKLRLMPDAVTWGLKASIRAWAKAILEEAQRRVRSQSYDTGHLYRTLRAIVSRDGFNAKVGIRRKGATKAEKAAFYGRFVELGTSKMPARPFLGPAFDLMREPGMALVTKDLNEALDKVCAGAMPVFSDAASGGQGIELNVDE